MKEPEVAGPGHRRARARLGILAIVAIAGAVARADLAAASDPCDAVPDQLARFDGSRTGQDVPATTFTPLGDGTAALTDFRGTGLVLNFWATWCAPCVTEMPDLDRASAALAGMGVRVLALSADFGGETVVRDFAAKTGLAHMALGLDPKGQVARGLGVRGLPTTVLFAADGREAGRIEGPAPWGAAPVVAFLAACLGPR